MESIFETIGPLFEHNWFRILFLILDIILAFIAFLFLKKSLPKINPKYPSSGKNTMILLAIIISPLIVLAQYFNLDW